VERTPHSTSKNRAPNSLGGFVGRFVGLRRTPFRDRRTEAEAGQLGLILLLASLATVFGATIVAAVSVRILDASPERWRPADGGALPWELLLSTVILLVGSVTIELAKRAVRRDDRARLVRWLRVTVAISFAFIASQVWCWMRMLDAGMPPTTSLFGWIFTVLTVLHALHVLAGVAALGLVLFRAEANRYSVEDHAGIAAAAIYWHFLDIMWICLLITLWAIA